MADHRTRLKPGTAPRQVRLRVNQPFLALKAEPKLRAAQLTELVYGQAFDVHEVQGRWAYGRVRALLPHIRRGDYVGWIEKSGLDAQTEPASFVVNVLSAPVFRKADLKSHIVMSLPLGAKITVIAERDAYLQIGAGAYIHRNHVRPIEVFETDPIAVARRYLGQPYVWGGNGARGVDCSGLVQMALTACGIDCPRDASQQENGVGESVPLASVHAGQGQPGDLLFWPGHVGILATSRRLLHANAYHMAVVEEPLGPALKRMEKAGVTLRQVRRL